jgi:hypothetical protein
MAAANLRGAGLCLICGYRRAGAINHSDPAVD